MDCRASSLAPAVYTPTTATRDSSGGPKQTGSARPAAHARDAFPPGRSPRFPMLPAAGAGTARVAAYPAVWAPSRPARWGPGLPAAPTRCPPCGPYARARGTEAPVSRVSVAPERAGCIVTRTSAPLRGSAPGLCRIRTAWPRRRPVLGRPLGRRAEASRAAWRPAGLRGSCGTSSR